MAENAKNCPTCGEEGRTISGLTLSAQLTDEAKSRLDSPEGFSFCRTAGCEVSYFGRETFHTTDVRHLIFHKSVDPARLVCYCFNHSVKEIECEVQATGASTVPNSIRESCKKGMDECEKNNPQGSCCLGNVSRIVKATLKSQEKSVASCECCTLAEESK